MLSRKEIQLQNRGIENAAKALKKHAGGDFFINLTQASSEREKVHDILCG